MSLESPQKFPSTMNNNCSQGTESTKKSKLAKYFDQAKAPPFLSIVGSGVTAELTVLKIFRDVTPGSRAKQTTVFQGNWMACSGKD